MRSFVEQKLIRKIFENRQNSIFVWRSKLWKLNLRKIQSRFLSSGSEFILEKVTNDKNLKTLFFYRKRIKIHWSPIQTFWKVSYEFIDFGEDSSPSDGCMTGRKIRSIINFIQKIMNHILHLPPWWWWEVWVLQEGKFFSSVTTQFVNCKKMTQKFFQLVIACMKPELLPESQDTDHFEPQMEPRVERLSLTELG